MNHQEFNSVLKAEYWINQKGLLKGEELTQIVEQRPWLFEALADYLKITKGEVRQFCAEGKVTSDDYFGAVIEYKMKNLFHWPESWTGQILEF